MKTYFWKCPCCGIAKQPAVSMDVAASKAEAHEAEHHGGKPVASYGWMLDG